VQYFDAEAGAIIEDARPRSLWGTILSTFSELDLSISGILEMARKTKEKPTKTKKAAKKKFVPEDQDSSDKDDDYDDEDEDEEDEDEDDEEYEDPGKNSEWSGGSGAEDINLINRFLEGDEEAFGRLVVKYQNKIHNLCFRVVGDQHEAEDMAQEVFMTAHKALKDFRGDSLFSTWIYRVAVNHCKNRIKFLGRRKYYQNLSMDQPQELGDGEVTIEMEDDSPDPEDMMESQQVQDLVQAAIETLDPDHRTVIVLRDIQELSYEEIAEIVGIRVGTVKSRIHRARNDLKVKLENLIKLAGKGQNN